MKRRLSLLILLTLIVSACAEPIARTPTQLQCRRPDCAQFKKRTSVKRSSAINLSTTPLAYNKPLNSTACHLGKLMFQFGA